MRDLSGKVAWITGAGTGIGEGAAIALAGAGMRLVLSGRRAEMLQGVAKRVVAAGGEARVLTLDVADGDAVDAAAADIASNEGRVDVLINSAGLNARKRNWKHLTRAAWDEVIRVDLDGAFYCCNAVLPMMRVQQDGLVINISSWAGRYVGVVTGPAYSAAKFALNAMTESLNMEECMHGIRATAVCPGEVSTPILELRPVKVTDEERARMVQPEDCGALILFLAQLPAHVCINELTISPTWNRGYVQAARMIPA